MKDFRKGDRVKYSEKAKQVFRLRNPNRLGTVISNSYNKKVSVIWDKTKTRRSYDESFIERD